MKKTKISIMICGLIFLCLILLWIYLNSNVIETKIYDVPPTRDKWIVVNDGTITEGEEDWASFLTNTSKGSEDSINIRLTDENSLWSKARLHYDTKLFRYYLISNQETTTLKYQNSVLLDVSGKAPGTSSQVDRRWIVLANGEYTFEELFESIVSSTNNNIQFDFLFMD